MKRPTTTSMTEPRVFILRRASDPFPLRQPDSRKSHDPETTPPYGSTTFATALANQVEANSRRRASRRRVQVVEAGTGDEAITLLEQRR